MSFVDLATLAMHCREEMEARIHVLVTKCDLAQENIQKLKSQATGLVNQLNCEPIELKDRFLKSMKQLDEYIYTITHFNLSISNCEETDNYDTKTLPSQAASTTTQTVVPKILEPVKTQINQAGPSSASEFSNSSKEKVKRLKVPKAGLLINLSSASCSQESVDVANVKIEKEEECELPVEQISNLTLQEPLENWHLPAQSVLQTEIYSGCICHIDTASIWVIVEQINEAKSLMERMEAYYRNLPGEMSIGQIESLSFCAYYDDASICAYRCLVTKYLPESDSVELFHVDTGEEGVVRRDLLRPLVREFCLEAPFARCCHLAGVELEYHQDESIRAEQLKYMKTFIGKMCDIEVDDNSSESLGVYILLSNNELFNELVVSRGIGFLEKATCNQASRMNGRGASYGPPEDFEREELFDIDGPEYEDPLEAVTGYQNRDEAEICKHYNGGPEKTCFKGYRCKKRHVMMHPDGWTRDQVEVTARTRSQELPPPASWLSARVSCVASFDRCYVQWIKQQQPASPRPSFGVINPPTTLESLEAEMNSQAGVMSFKKPKIAPAPGELVIAMYPPDEKWYRALVLGYPSHDQTIEVRYIDYGNELCIKENLIREMNPQFALLPQQSVLCRLAGVCVENNDPEMCVKVRYIDYGNELCIKENLIREMNPQFALLPQQSVLCRLAGVCVENNDPEMCVKAKNTLQQCVLEKVVRIHVLARHYDELEIEMYDSEGYSVSQMLAAQNLVILREQHVQDEGYSSQVVVVP